MKNLLQKDQKQCINFYRSERKRLVYKYLVNVQKSKDFKKKSDLFLRLQFCNSEYKNGYKLRCILTGCSRGVYHKYRLSRYLFKHNFETIKEVYSLKKASW